MKATWIVAAVLVLTLGSSAAWGQTYGSQGTGFWEGPGYRQRVWYGPYGGGYGGYGGFGTYEGSVLFGLGAYARGTGEYNYYSALAASELQEARAQAIKNHKQEVETWLSLRKAHQDRRQAEWEKEKLTPEEIVRVVESNRPARLAPGQYEPATGRISWPEVLMGDALAAERAALEAAFAKRTVRDAGADSDFYHRVSQITKQIVAKLPQDPELGAMQRVQAKKFLTSLRYESLSPSDVEALASRE